MITPAFSTKLVDSKAVLRYNQSNKIRL